MVHRHPDGLNYNLHTGTVLRGDDYIAISCHRFLNVFSHHLMACEVSKRSISS